MFFGGGFPGFDDGFPGASARRPKKDVDTEAFYKTLEVSKTASSAEIKKAYRKLAIKHHPDKGGDPETFKVITKAYECLSDDDKRKLYDQYGEEGLEQGGGGGDPTDIFDMVFGGGGGRAGAAAKRKGKDSTHPMDITLEQIYNGHTKKLAINRTVIDQNYGVKECSSCNGRGSVVQILRRGNMIQQMQNPCHACNQSGKIFKTNKEKEILEVYVERGAPHGHKIVFRNKADEQPGYESGDVIFNIQEKAHAVFKRVRADLFISKKITLLEALTGFSMELTHLDGRKLMIQTKPGEVICPQATEEPEWEVFDDTDCPDDDVAKCTYSDIAKLKEVCISKDFKGFVLDQKENTAYFRSLSRDEFLSKKKSNKSTKGLKLYVVPDPKTAAKFRMRKAIKGEGMPLFKNSMLRGNLFIDITIEFPEKVEADAIAALKKVLPGPEIPAPADTEDHEHHFLTDMDPKESEDSSSHAYEEDTDDDRAAGRHPGGGAQCTQQ